MKKHKIKILISLILYLLAQQTVIGQTESRDSILINNYEDSCNTTSKKALKFKELADKYVDNHDYAEAKSYYLKSIKYDSLFCSPYLSVSGIFAQEGMLDSAEYYCKKALKLNPSHHALTDLATIYGMAGKYRSAKEILLKLVSDSFELKLTYFTLAEVCFRNGEDNKTIENAEKSLKLCKDDKIFIGKNVFLIGCAYALKNNKTMAKKYFLQAMEYGIEIPIEYKKFSGL